MTRSIDELLARSSLGTRSAQAKRRSAPKAVVERVLLRSNSQPPRQISLTQEHMAERTDPRSKASGSLSTGDHQMVAAMTLLPGQFVIAPVRPVGEGGLGIVDEVEVVDSNLSHAIGTRLARKRLSARWSCDSGARERFEREIDMLGVMDHPNVVSLEGVSLPEFERFYVMPFFERGSLRSCLEGGGRFKTIQQVAKFIAAIADALTYAHSMNFIHRDLKPENVLISDEGRPIISDWGLGQFVHLHSKVLDLTRGGPMGSHYYCSLEQWNSGRCDETGDVYSLGVMFAELVAGRALPITPVGSGIRQDVISGSSAVVKQLNATIRKMTSLVPSARFQSMAEVASVLNTIGASA